MAHIIKAGSWIEKRKPLKGELDLERLIQDNSGGGALPYKIYTALLTQTGTDAPVATVLQNTLGVTPTYSRISQGNYFIIFPSGYLTPYKTIVFLNDNLWRGTHKITVNDTQNGITMDLFSSDLDVGVDNYIYDVSIEIRVYP